MFESVERERATTLWKILPIAAIGFALVAGVTIFLLRPSIAPKAEVTGIVRKGDPDYDWYSKYVDLHKPQVQMGKNYAGSRIVMFSGIIRNNGEKALDAVEVQLLFFNANVPVWEATRIPIRPGPGTYTPPIEPLEQRGFTLYIEDLPKGWHASNAEMAVSGFRFASKR